MNKKIMGSTIALALTASLSVGSADAALAADAILDFSDGVEECLIPGGAFPNCTANLTTVRSGSYFAGDISAGGTPGAGIFEESERVAISSAGNGITLGARQARGEVDNIWPFAGNPGEHYTADADGVTVTSASGNSATINMSGWTVWWGNVAAGADGPIDVGAGDDAIVTCGVDCSIGDTFALDYKAIVPSGGFQGVLYGLHLEGVIGASAVPVPAAVWLFGSGLVGLAGVVRRRKAV